MLQQALLAWGSRNGLELLPKYGADGAFGGETVDAVEAFQAVHGGGRDGVVGPLTLFHLDMFVLGGASPGGGGLVVEDEFVGDMGDGRRMRKTEFLSAVEDAACSLARTMLANTEYSFDDCAGLFAFLQFLHSMSADEIEQTIIAGTAGVGAEALRARTLIDVVLAQVGASIAAFLTGQSIGVILADLGAPDFVIELAEKDLGGGCGGSEGGCTAKKEVGSGGGEALSPKTVQHRIRQEGRPLDTGVRARMQRVMGFDFQPVRVHTGPAAHEVASTMNARAFTVGNDIGFARGEYHPGDLVGDALIAHELAHVQQQRGATEEETSPGSQPGLEESADRSALSALLRLGGRVWDGVTSFGTAVVPRLKSKLRLSRCTPCPAADAEIKEYTMGVFELAGHEFYMKTAEEHIAAAQKIWEKEAKIKLNIERYGPPSLAETFDMISHEEWAELGTPSADVMYSDVEKGKCYIDRMAQLEKGEAGEFEPCTIMRDKETKEEYQKRKDAERKRINEMPREKLISETELSAKSAISHLDVTQPNSNVPKNPEGEALKAWRQKVAPNIDLAAFVVRLPGSAEGGHTDGNNNQLYYHHNDKCSKITGYTFAHETAHLFFGDNIHGESGLLKQGSECISATLPDPYCEDARKGIKHHA